MVSMRGMECEGKCEGEVRLVRKSEHSMQVVRVEVERERGKIEVSRS